MGSNTLTVGRLLSAKSLIRWKSLPMELRLRPRSRFARFTNLPELQQMFRRLCRCADGRDAGPSASAPGRRQSRTSSPVRCRRAVRSPTGAGGSLRPHPLAESRSARGQRPGDHHRWPQARPRCPDALRRTHPTSRTRKSTPLSTTWPPSGKHRRHTRHADDFLRYGRQSDALGIFGLRRDHPPTHRARHPRASRSPPSAMPIPTPRNKRCSRKSGSGPVRVLIGSTQKMGTGTNVQKRLVALHHLDAPWKPAEVEQREGRILRQGNETRKWRSIATSPKDLSMLICGRPWKPRPGLSRR